MSRAYIPTPCRRCGGDKGPRITKNCRPRYCEPCQKEAVREYWRKNFLWWCGCENLHYCPTCNQNKRDRAKAAARTRKKPDSRSNYFRPEHAESWWQQRAHRAVKAAIKRGVIPSLKTGEYACVDCGGVALVYEHRDYSRPYEVEPVCKSCNSRRGTAVWPAADRYEFARVEPAKCQKAA